MRIAVGSDEKTPLTDAVVDYLRARGLEVQSFGSLTGEKVGWPRQDWMWAVRWLQASVTKASSSAGPAPV